jgi:hypothetical protein
MTQRIPQIPHPRRRDLKRPSGTSGNRAQAKIELKLPGRHTLLRHGL